MSPHHGLSFAHLNLRWNPFGELDLDERQGLAVVDVGDLPQGLREHGTAIQLVGACGRGKTTHLLALWGEFPKAPWLKLAEGGGPSVPSVPVVFVDDVDHLRDAERLAVFRRVRSIAFTTHEDRSDELREAGLRALTLQVGGTSPERLASILCVRIEHARRAAGPVPRVPDEAVRRLAERFGDDIRAVEHYLYDRFQDLTGIGDVEV